MVILVTTTMIDMIVMTGTIEMINDDSKNANMAKRSIVRKLPSYGRMSRGSLVIMFIMSSSCEQHSEQKQFVTTKWAKAGCVWEEYGTNEFKGENTLGRNFSGNVAPGVAEVTLSVSASSGLDVGKLS